MWDEYGFNGNVNDVDSGVQNIRKGVAKIMTNEASAEQASFNVDTEFGDLAGAIARNSLASFIGLATPNSIDGPPFENIL